MRRLILVLASVLAPLAAEAATYRIDVQGYFSGGSFSQLMDTGTYERRSLSFDDPNSVTFLNGREYIDLSGHGSVTVETETGAREDSALFSGCSGILTTLCRSSDQLSLMNTSTGDVYGVASDFFSILQVEPSNDQLVGRYGYHLGLSSDFRVLIGGTIFSSFGNSPVSVEYNLTEYSLSAVPLPATVWSLLVALGGLGLWSRIRRPFDE